MLRVLHKGQRVTPSDTPINSVRITIHVVIYGTLAQLYDMYTTVLVMHHEETGRFRRSVRTSYVVPERIHQFSSQTYCHVLRYAMLFSTSVQFSYRERSQIDPLGGAR